MKHNVQRRDINRGIDIFSDFLLLGFFLSIWPLKKGGADKPPAISKRVVMEVTLRLSQPEWMDRAEGASLEKKGGLSFYVLQRHLPSKISDTWATLRDSH